MAVMNLGKAEYAKKVVSRTRGCKLAFSSPTFNEFVLEIDGDPEKVLEKLKEERILGGLPLAKFYPELDHHLLITVTEMLTREEIDRWIEALGKLLR
jgi:glycine dehydrogenase subunit 1